MKSLSALLYLWPFLHTVFAATPEIQEPVNGTKIAPGSSFKFKYQSIADYATSSYQFTVMLFTTPPKEFTNSLDFASGYSFGQFDVQNYPAIPSARHPAPETLTMPDFSKPLGGWGSGASVSNAIFYLVVLEEYGTGTPSIGRRMNLAVNEIVYNSTDEVA
ncbi:hypothetical protein VKT23_003815 [Stygiomarasmius scandens]|uniref:Uncharacterized protein n=1 Tax=Marasmiellus scandens TaxID=2682957 RepID=A0ABR1JYE6_9AGAR